MLTAKEQEVILLSLVAAFEVNNIEMTEQDYLDLTTVVDHELTDISFTILKVLANHGYNLTNNRNMSFALSLKITGDFLNELVVLGTKGDTNEKVTNSINFRTIYDNWMRITQQRNNTDGDEHRTNSTGRQNSWH